MIISPLGCKDIQIRKVFEQSLNFFKNSFFVSMPRTFLPWWKIIHKQKISHVFWFIFRFIFMFIFMFIFRFILKVHFKGSFSGSFSGSLSIWIQILDSLKKQSLQNTVLKWRNLNKKSLQNTWWLKPFQWSKEL